MATLYEMTMNAMQLYDMLQAEEIDEQTFNDTLEAIGAEEKLEAYCQVLKQLQADVEMFKAEKNRIAARQKTAENSIERLKSAMLLYMQATNQEKAKAGTFSVSVATTKAVEIIDASIIPEMFLIAQDPKIDKAGIKEAIKSGAIVNGAILQENKGVRIR